VWTLALPAVLWVAGCAGYRVGPTNGVPAKSKSIQVNLFQNQTLEPRLAEPLATALRRILQQDGTYRLNTSGAGDIVVQGEIIEFRRSELSFRPEDILTVRDYALSLVAHVKAIDRATGATVLDRAVRGRTSIRVGNDLTSAERQAIPLLAEDLARNLAALLVDGDW
jgi:hypothetical protein